jgi:hypothetical protein
MASFITPVRPIDTAPPWDWNPGATFTRAFNDAQELQVKREQIENERQIMEILLPYKVKKAALDLEKLRSDVKVQEASVDIERDRLNFRNRALDDEINSRRNPRPTWLGPGKGFSSSSNPLTDEYSVDDPLPPTAGGEPMIYNEDGSLNAEPLPTDEETDVLPMEGGALRVPTNPLVDDEEDGFSQNSNPLLRDDFFGNIANNDGPKLSPSSTEGFENPLAAVDRDATSVPIGATDSRFDAGLGAEEPESNLSENATDRLGRMVAGAPEPAPAETEQDKILKDLAGRYQTIQANKRSDYESALREGIQVPRELERFYAEDESALFQEADAVMTPLIASLPEPQQAAYMKLTTSARPMFPLAAYQRVSAMSQQAQQNPENASDIMNLQKQIMDVYGEDKTQWPTNVKAFESALTTKLNKAAEASGAKIPTAWDEYYSVIDKQARLDAIDKNRDPQFEFDGQLRSRDEIPGLKSELDIRKTALMRSPELRDQLRVTRDTYTVFKDDKVDRAATEQERQRQLSNLTPDEPYEDEDGNIKFWRPKASTEESEKTRSGFRADNKLAQAAVDEKRGQQQRQSQTAMTSIDGQIKQVETELAYQQFVQKNLESPTRAGGGQANIQQNRAVQLDKTLDRIGKLEETLQRLRRSKPAPASGRGR